METETSQHKDIWDVRDLLGWHKGHPWAEEVLYRGVFASGDFKAMTDYNVGLFTLHLELQLSDPKGGRCDAFLTITTTDDGVWRAQGTFKCVEDARATLDMIESDWPFKTRLPTEQQLNEFLKPYRMWGSFTG